MKSVSIIVPVYNTQKYLKKCLNSLVNQTFDDIEIITINDGSTDKSLGILKEYATKYPSKIKLINSINQGAGKARNLGIEASTGKYIWFVDSDDYLRKDAVEKMYDIAEYYDASMVACGYQKRIGIIKKPSKVISEVSLINLDEEKNYLINGTARIWNRMVKKEVIGNLRMPALKWEDLSYTFSLIAQNKEFYYLTDRLYTHRIALGNTTTGDIIKPTPRIVEIFDGLSILEKRTIEDGLYEQYKEQIEKIYISGIIRRCADVTTWMHLSTENKKKIINLLINAIELKYNDFNSEEISNNFIDLNPVLSFCLKKYGLPLLDKNMRCATSEEQIKEDIVKILK